MVAKHIAKEDPRKTLLVASFNRDLADIKKHVLEKAGYHVIPVFEIRDIKEMCKRNKVDLVLIGYSVPPAEKRRVALESRKHCRTPILELYRNERPELVEQTRMYAYKLDTSDDFLSTVKSILD